MNRQSWAGTTAVITGASSGIGRQIAERIALAGAEHIIVHYRLNREGAREIAEKIGSLGKKATLIQADFSLPDDISRFADEIWRASKQVHAFVHNAGADVLTGTARQQSFEEKLDLLIRVDVIGSIRLGRLVASRMLAQDSTERPPAMAFIGWDQAPYAMEGDAGQIFGPVKAAVMAFALSLAQTHGPHLRVNVVAPGWIRTSWGESTSDYWNARATSQSLMQRWGSPNDVADAILYACDPFHTFVTGQVLDVNGGFNRWPGPQQCP